MATADHDAHRAMFSDYLDGELSPAEAAELEAHLAGCPECAAELEELRTTLSTLRGLRPVAPPPEFVSKVQQRIRKRSRGRFFEPERLLTRVPFEWLSFMIILAMMALYLMNLSAQIRAVGAASDAGVGDAVPADARPAVRRDAGAERVPGDADARGANR